MSQNFSLFRSNAPIGKTAAGEDIFASQEFLRSLGIVKALLEGIDAPTTILQPSVEPTPIAQAAPVQTVEALLPVQVPQMQRFETAWPVGSVFVSAVADNPAILLGFGVWTQVGGGKFPVGYLAGDPDFGTLGGTGGAKTKAISAHSGAAVADHASHTHQVTSNVTATSTTAGAGATSVVTSITNNTVTSAGPNAPLTHSVTQPSDHTALNVLPPYLVLNFWQRTA